MSLEAALAATPPAGKGPACTVARIKARLSPEDIETLNRNLAEDDPFMVTRLAAALKKEGHVVSEATLRRHKAGRCGCP